MDVEWRPFYLRPDTPPQGMELPAYILQARAAGSEERLRDMAREFGMKFLSPERIYNTRMAHEAAEFAREHDLGNQFHHAVFDKIFAEGMDISKWEVLRSAAELTGLQSDEMQQAVESGKYAGRVADQVRQAYKIGISGVPTYVINGRYALVGAQPYEMFQQVLDKIFKEVG